MVCLCLLEFFSSCTARDETEDEKGRPRNETSQNCSAARHSEASQPAAIYNLQGQRLDSLQRGVNIIGGKKISNF